MLNIKKFIKKILERGFFHRVGDANPDCDTAGGFGSYNFGTSTSHRPFNYGTLLNLIFSDDYKSQLAVNANTQNPQLLIRGKSANGWGAWRHAKPFYTAQDINIGTINAASTVINPSGGVPLTSSDELDLTSDVAVCGWEMDGANFSLCVITRLKVENKHIYYTIRNTHATAAATNVTLKVCMLYL